MAQVTLTRDQVSPLVRFCETAVSEEYFVAKDHGAYVGYSIGAEPHERCITSSMDAIRTRTAILTTMLTLSSDSTRSAITSPWMIFAVFWKRQNAGSSG